MGGGVLASFVVGIVALEVAQATGTTAAWWPAAGVGVITALLATRSQRPATYAALGVAFALANLLAGRSVAVSALLGVADVAETIFVTTLLIRYVGKRMDDVMDVWRLFTIAAGGAVVAGLGIGLTYALLLDASFLSTVALVVPAHGAAVVLLAPFALIRWPASRTTPRTGAPELVLQVLLLLGVIALTFGSSDFTLGFAALPVLVWAAVRFSELVLLLEQVAFAGAVTLFTQIDRGPFAQFLDTGPGTSTQHAQLYLICLALVGLPLTRAMQQRDVALARALASDSVFTRSFTESRVPVAIVTRRDGELRFSDCNAATAALLQRSPEELSGLRVDEVLVSAELPEAARQIIRGEATGWAGLLEVVDQPRTRLDATLSPIQAPDGRATFSLHLLDVTESREAQARLQAERDYTRAVIDTSRSMLVLTDRAGTVIAANQMTTDHTGFAEEELVGRPVWDLLFAEGERSGVAAVFADPAGLPRSGEAQLRTRDGGQRAIVFSSAVHRTAEDAPLTVVISATDVTEARQDADMIQNLLRSARTIAFVGTDLAGRITLFNTGAEHMLGIDAASATGRDFVDFISGQDLALFAVREPDRSPFEAVVGQASGDLSPQTRDWTWLPLGRPQLRVSMTTNPVTDTFGGLIGYLFVANDITDTRRSQEILIRALRREREVVSRLQDLDRAKDDFVSTVSHELRTPMSSIIGSAEMLGDGLLGELEPDQQHMVDVIARNGGRLLKLADDLLLLATFDRESWPERPITIDLRDVVNESASSVASMLANRKLELAYTLPDSPVLVCGDANHLERAVTNLLTNGVKFTEDGGRIHIEVGSQPTTGSAVLTVTDTGLGISAQDMDMVWGRFFRSSTVQEQAIQGSGLGLSIVKTIVESHDGQVDVTSAEGIGTTFTVTLPLA